MRRHNRYLEFQNIEQGEPIKSECSLCHRVFLGKPKPDERTDDVILRVRADFEAHDCHEDASQSAARIVREATKD